MIIPSNLTGLGVVAYFTEKSDEQPSVPEGFRQIYRPVQRHTSELVVLTQRPSVSNTGHTALLGTTSEAVIADAVITDIKGLLIGVLVADCVPVLVADRDLRAIAAVHAGWRGTAMGILKKVISCLKELYSIHPKEILLAIGPSIRKCCYEVGHEVADAVISQSGPGQYYVKKQDRFYIDLAMANLQQALQEGIPEGNIFVSDECTFCYRDRFYSYRREKTSSRQGGFIGIREEK